jgi:hypothetical protein
MTACATLTSAIKLMTTNTFINTESHSLIVSSSGERLTHNPSAVDGVVKPRLYGR